MSSRRLIETQMPFHFHGEVPAGFSDGMVGSPEVLRHFANEGYGNFDYVPQLGRVSKPTLVIVGEHDLERRRHAPRACSTRESPAASSRSSPRPGT